MVAWRPELVRAARRSFSARLTVGYGAVGFARSKNIGQEPTVYCGMHRRKRYPMRFQQSQGKPYGQALLKMLSLVWTGNSDERKTTRLPARAGGRAYIQENN
ncbi:hypothetical protein K470DRAFT_45698 [Piedraia hortae CBS 480.64]|uniref:Uncharacterized protein n=1 Tax=Piedraia hortae CBS 480.64 TaxID=1314780 RepID=A0A6A7C2U0_9PEZI|nr:hypothetical protein K470DRAFT_45698 [Piedraia hortae CBS 480.64]